MKFYRFRSHFGVLLIQPEARGRWCLVVKDKPIGSYHSAAAAADDVYSQVTGDCDWDSLDGVDIPADISGWEVILFKR